MRSISSIDSRTDYPYFYEADYGQLRPVVERTVDRFLDCGIYRGG